MNRLFTIFGCHHDYSFPRTPRTIPMPEAAKLTGTYVVCLNCGKEFPYDWAEMKIVTPETYTPSPTKISAATAAQ